MSVPASVVGLEDDAAAAEWSNKLRLRTETELQMATPLVTPYLVEVDQNVDAAMPALRVAIEIDVHLEEPAGRNAVQSSAEKFRVWKKSLDASGRFNHADVDLFRRPICETGQT